MLYQYFIIIGLLITYCFQVYTQALEWDTTHYIWDFGLISACDKGMDKKPQIYFSCEHEFDKHAYQACKAGDIVWVQCRFLSEFYQQVLPTLKHPIVLLVSDGDESFPSDCDKNFNIEDLLSHPLIIHVFAQNCDYAGSSKKVSHIPIGMDFHTVAYKGESGGWGEKGLPQEQEAQLRDILKTLKPTHLRKKKAFVDFQVADTMHGGFRRYLQFHEDRRSIFNRLLPTGLIDYDGWMRRSDLWRRKGEYAFSISPHGNGLDCHRTWEDMVLGCIVIVKTSPLDPMYQGLPIVIVKDWSEITIKNLDKWLRQYSDAFTNPAYREKLTNYYWFSKILAKVQLYKTSKEVQ